jgi:hypothetical protein
MMKMYENMLVEGLTRFLETQSKESETPKEELRLVIQITNGSLGAFLYSGSKFKRQIGFAELVKLLF